MAHKISTEKLHSIINEETKRLQRISELKQRQAVIKEELDNLAEDFDDVESDMEEGVFGGLSNMFRTGANALSQTYKQGSAQQELTKIYNQIKTLDSQVMRMQTQSASLKAQYQQIAKKPFTGKAVASPAEFRKPAPVSQQQQGAIVNKRSVPIKRTAVPVKRRAPQAMA